MIAIDYRKEVKKIRLGLKKTLAVLMLAVLLIAGLPVNVIASGNVYSWYCKRTKDHTQPSLPKEFEFISSYGGYYIDVSNYSPDAENKKVYLTFDAGYENGNVEKILDILKEHQVPAAFFVLSNLISTCPDLITRMANEGHLVCNHTSKHKDMSRVNTIEEFEKELSDLEKLYKEKTGREMPKYFRPPEGKFSEEMLNFANDKGYKTIFWSFAYADWDNNNQMIKDRAKAKIMDNIHNGAVILLHPTSATNAAILEEVICELKADGYTFGTLDELVANNICRQSNS